MVKKLDKGSLIWTDFNPQAGHEQAGHRPALVVSQGEYNAAAGFAVVVPITNQEKGWPFEVKLPEGLAFSGVVLADQVKSFDLEARSYKVQGTAPQEVMDEVDAKIAALMGWP